MSVYLKNLSLERITNITFCLFPLSFILGSLIIHLNLYLFLILSVIYIKKKNYKFNLSYTSNILICFFLFIIISSLINIESIKYDFFFRSILLFRFAILYLVLEVLLINNKINLKNFFITSLVCSSFVSFDIIFQYIFGHDLFGYGPDAGGRLTAVFGEEAIAGSYIQKFSLLSFFGLLFLFNKKDYKGPVLFSILVLNLVGVFFTNNKMSLISLLLSLILLFLFDKKLRLLIILSIITFIFIAKSVFKHDNYLKGQYQYVYERFFTEQVYIKTENKSEEKTTQTEKNKKLNIYNSSHIRLYLTTIESWKNNPIVGGGHKSFRIICHNVSDKKINFFKLCSTHPHNYHLEILHDFGLIGFITITIFVFIILFKIVKKLKRKKLIGNTYDMYFIPIIITMFIEIWPIKSSGSLFTTVSGTFVWLIIALLSIVNTNFNDENLDKNTNNKNLLVLNYSLILLTSLIIKKFYFI